jgi:AraC-like DNA-binding protein
MTSLQTVRFWRPAPELASELVCTHLGAAGSPLHLHEEWQFGVPETASKLSLGAFRRYTATASDLTVVPPYEVHAEGVDLGPASRWWMLYIAPSLVTRLCGGTPHVARPVVSDPAAALELRELLRRSGAGTMTGSDFLDQLTRWLEAFLSRHAEAAPTQEPTPAVERARAYLQSHPTEVVTLPEVGAAVGVTVSHLVRSFSSAVGLPPGRYHAQVRLARARRLLWEGKSVGWVAYECGFADQSHLNRRFREHYGLTPGAFLEQAREQSGAAFVDVESSAA